MKIGLIGSGSFGTALGSLLADKGYDVLMWTRSQEQADGINQFHKNKKHLSDLVLPEKLKASTNLEEVVRGKDLILSAPPSHVLTEIIHQIKEFLPNHAPIVSATKGIENGTLKMVSEIFESELPGRLQKNLSYLSGPSFAREIINKVPTVVSIASKNEGTAKTVQEIFSLPYFRTYWTPDVTVKI